MLKYRCSECDFNSRLKYSLMKHINEFHPKFIYCPECKRSYKSKYSFKKHNYTYHNSKDGEKQGGKHTE